MGRWSFSSRRTAESCHSISTKFLNKYKYFLGGLRSGGITWSVGGRETGSVGFRVSTETANEYINFIYTQTDRITNEKTEFDYKVQLTWTSCHFGGRRWWFVCPLMVNGRACGRRMGVLYLGGEYFGCRHCYNLTYASCKEHDKRVDHLLRHPDLMLPYAQSGSFSRLTLAFKASTKYLSKVYAQ